MIVAIIMVMIMVKQHRNNPLFTFWPCATGLVSLRLRTVVGGGVA